MPLIQLHECNFDATLNDCERSLICFSMKHCKPCNVVKLKMALCAHQFADEFSCFVVDVMHSPTLRNRYSADVVPKIIAFRRGEMLRVFRGPRTVERLRRFATSDDFDELDLWMRTQLARERRQATCSHENRFTLDNVVRCRDCAMDVTAQFPKG